MAPCQDLRDSVSRSSLGFTFSAVQICPSSDIIHISSAPPFPTAPLLPSLVAACLIERVSKKVLYACIPPYDHEKNTLQPPCPINQALSRSWPMCLRNSSRMAHSSSTDAQSVRKHDSKPIFLVGGANAVRLVEVLAQMPRCRILQTPRSVQHWSPRANTACTPA